MRMKFDQLVEKGLSETPRDLYGTRPWPCGAGKGEIRQFLLARQERGESASSLKLHVMFRVLRHALFVDCA
jgi:hypothetical protein